ncbi:MAG: Mu P family protein [Ahrensia sp.]|nr:Mu P family protein [Ahrensia sp.]
MSLFARPIRMLVAGLGEFDEFTSVEVTRDLQDFAGSFSVTLRDAVRSINTFKFASAANAALFALRPGPSVSFVVGGETVLVGWIEKVDPKIDSEFAEVTISGRDKSGDLVDSAAASDGPGELKRVKLEDAAAKIAQPFGLRVRSEVDTGEPFERYPLDLTETGLSAIEKGARQRNVLVTSDGVGGIVITRTGSQNAPAALTLPGNVLEASASFSTEGRFSETIVRGQGEKAGGERRERPAPQLWDSHATDLSDRQPTDGSATQRERRGTAITGRARDPEITRHRPKVHLTKTQPDATANAAQNEADWRSRTSRANGEEATYTVHGFGENGVLWKVNQLPDVSDSYLGIERPMLISRTVYRYDAEGATTELTVTSPEAFDDQPVARRRSNLPRAKSVGGRRTGGALDSTARAL